MLARWGRAKLGREKAGRIRTSLRALPDLAAVVWRVGGEVRWQAAVWQGGSTAQVQKDQKNVPVKL